MANDPDDVRAYLARDVLDEANRMASRLRDVAKQIESTAFRGTEWALEGKTLGMGKPRTHIDTVMEVLAIVRTITGDLHTESLLRRARDADLYNQIHPKSTTDPEKD
jgi:hypothetical protein